MINLTVQAVKLPTKDAIPGPPLETRQLGLITQLISTVAPFNTGSGTGSDTTIVDGPGLQVVKTPDGGTINAGDTATFTIVVSNTGTGTATSVTLDDTLPGPVTWSLAPGSPAGCSVVANVLHCDLGDLAARRLGHGGVDGADHGGNLHDLQQQHQRRRDRASDEPHRPGAASDSRAASAGDRSGLITCQPPNLHVVKTPDGGTINAGDTATFTIVVSNSGPGTANSVTLNDALPGPVTWSVAAGSPSAGTCDAIVGNVLHCDLGNLASGASVTVVLTAPTTAATCTTYNNNTNGGAIALGTNAAQVTDPGSITCQPSNLHVVKTPDGGTINAGDTATFTIVVSNSGPATANSVTLNDALPGPVTWSLAPGSPSAGTCNPIVGNVLHCDLGNLASGASVTVVLTAPTTVATCTTYNNNTNGGAIAVGTNAAQVTDPGSITCQPPLTPSLHVVKTPDTGIISAGETATFTIVVGNSGPATATGVTLDDNLPGPVTWSLASGPAGCSVVANVLHCALGDLAAGASVTVTVTAPTTAETCTNYPNLATANATNIPQAVTDPGNITCQRPPPPPPPNIPTLSQWGLFAVSILTLLIALAALRRRQGGTT